MFTSIIDINSGLTGKTALICTLASLVFGAVAMLIYRINNKAASKNLMVSLVVLPTLVQAVIMLVNGSVGAGIAVMGAFNLVRFRSTPGSSRDICYIFYAMGIGLATGMGYLGFAGMITLAVGIVLVALSFIPAFSVGNKAKLLRILIPEDMNYTDCFDDIFAEYDPLRKTNFLNNLALFITDATKAVDEERNTLIASKLWRKHLGDRNIQNHQPRLRRRSTTLAHAIQVNLTYRPEQRRFVAVIPFEQTFRKEINYCLTKLKGEYNYDANETKPKLVAKPFQ